jgi:Fur family ferric uptake transcriptional regulator
MAKPASAEQIQTAETVFREYLRDRGLKYTDERRELLRAVMHNDEHFEAEQLLLQLRQAGSRVAKATIYRTLPLLVSCGIVKAVQFSNDRVHYEHTYGQDPHDHMVCRRCGRIIEFDSSDVDRLRTAIAARHAFYAVSHRLQIMGLCQQCVQNCPVVARPVGAAPSARRGAKRRR